MAQLFAVEGILKYKGCVCVLTGTQTIEVGSEPTMGIINYLFHQNAKAKCMQQRNLIRKEETHSGER